MAIKCESSSAQDDFILKEGFSPFHCSRSTKEITDFLYVFAYWQVNTRGVSSDLYFFCLFFNVMDSQLTFYTPFVITFTKLAFTPQSAYSYAVISLLGLSLHVLL